MARIIWAPQPGPQQALIECPFPEVFFGGSRGGGKSDGILGKWLLKGLRYARHFNAVFFRREMPQQDDLIERARDIYGQAGADWQEQKKRFILPGGGMIRFRPLDATRDADKYQGQSLTDAAVEESGNYPTSEPIDRLFGCLRSVHGVPVQMILTANPKGVGHGWLKARYINPSPTGWKPITRILPNNRTHTAIYIPSRITDNRKLLDADPEYVSRLYMVGDDLLVRAWLNGDWGVQEGAFFQEFSIERHVIEPFTLPEHWLRFRSMDWGSAAPFVVHWWAVVQDAMRRPSGHVLPRGALLGYREWYGASKPNVGLKMTAERVGEGIVSRENEKIAYGSLDPSAFAANGMPSIAERLAQVGARFRPADNTRVGRDGHMGGWDLVRARLQGDGDGHPMLYLFSTCINTIRTFPLAQHDERSPEDMATDGDDHCLDSVRYACSSRPWVPATQPPARAHGVTLDELWDEAGRRTGAGRI